MNNYRHLQKGEIVQAGDEYDACNDGWRDPVDWREVTPNMIGTVASDPQYVSHMQFRRPVFDNAQQTDSFSGADGCREDSE